MIRALVTCNLRRSALVSIALFGVVAASADERLPGQKAAGFSPRWWAPGITAMPTEKMGPFIRLPDRSILTVDRDAAVLSTDEGKTWGKPIPMFSAERPFEISNERALVLTQQGTVVLACMDLKSRGPRWWDAETKTFPDDMRCDVYVVRSRDRGQTWSPPQLIQQGYCGAIRGFIQTRDGRLVLAAQNIVRDPPHHAVTVYTSNDDGATWQPGAYIDAKGKSHAMFDIGGRGHHDGAIEPTLVELQDGRLWMLLRTGLDAQWQAWSRDGGQTWTDFGPSPIAASSAPAMFHRLADGRLLLCWNQLYPENTTDFERKADDWHAKPSSYHREELSVAVSSDEGKTWSMPYVIARAPGAWLSYPYVFEREPGELWISTMQGRLRLVLKTADIPTPAADAKPLTIVTFGDSITARRGSLVVYSDWLLQASRKLGYRATLFNAGVPGNTTTKGRLRFERDVVARKPDLVVIQFGINDSAVDLWKDPPATESRVTLADYEANLRHFAKTLKAQGAKVVLMTPNAMTWSKVTLAHYGKPPYKPDDPAGFNVTLRPYLDVMRKVAREEADGFVDVFALYEKHGIAQADALLLDGMHPNSDGQKLVFDHLWPVVEPLLPGVKK